MEMNNTRTPQYPFERLYVSPFTRRRGFNEQTLTYTLVPMEQKRQRTGIELLDLVVDCLIAGSDPRSVAYKLGITLEKLSASLITLTGLSTVSLRKQWRMQLAHDLLRYTNLPFTDVMQRCGYTSMPTFSNFVRQAWGSTPKTIRINAQRRRRAEERTDVGRVGHAFKNGNATGIAAKLLHRGQGRTAHGAKRTAGQGEARQLSQKLTLCGKNGNVAASLNDVGYRAV